MKKVIQMVMLYGFSIFMICSGVAVAIIIATDLKFRPQQMKLMNTVWVLTGLWGSYPALWAYYRFGRKNSRIPEDAGDKMSGGETLRMSMEPGMSLEMPEENRKRGMDMAGVKKGMRMDSPVRPRWQQVALSTLYCGAGCALADLIGESVTYYYPFRIGGSVIAGSWVFDFVLALLAGGIFNIRQPFKADFFSLASWQAGMYGWMALVYFVLFQHTSLGKGWIFWFMMQIAMLFGFFFAYPVNALLIKRGIKKGM